MAGYLIGRANELFYIAKSIEISQKTQMFMLTLFTTVGTHCCKDPHYTVYFNKILEGVAAESIERIKIAVSLRTSENDMWNDLYDGKTTALTKEFVARFTKYKKVQDKKKYFCTSNILFIVVSERFFLFFIIIVERYGNTVRQSDGNSIV